jgi:hypothetical protein
MTQSKASPERDQPSLELNKVIVKKIHDHPELMGIVHSNLQQVLHGSSLSESCKDSLREWEKILKTRPTEDVLNLLVEDSDKGQRLRQSTPFWGILTPQQRTSVFERFRLYEPAGT